MPVKLPERVFVQGIGLTDFSNIAVNLCFEVDSKNNFHFIVLLDKTGHAVVKKEEYLAAFDADRRLFLMDYTDPRTTFAGHITGEVMDAERLARALNAYEIFKNATSFPPGYKEALERSRKRAAIIQSELKSVNVDIQTTLEI